MTRMSKQGERRAVSRRRRRPCGAVQGGPLGGGWIYDSFGSYNWLYIASAAIGLAAAAMALAFPPAKRDADQTGVPQAA